MNIIMFPGQGSQYPNMALDLTKKYPYTKVIFEQASDLLKYDLEEVINDLEVDKLNLTEYTQPAMMVCNYAFQKVLQQETEHKFQYAIGHSLGEYNALLAADAISFGDCVKLVATRAKMMQLACKKRAGSMAAILGLELPALEEICKDCSSNGQIIAANINTKNQIVLSGDTAAIIEAMQLAKERGAKRTVLLPVSVASHSPLMNCIAGDFSNVLRDIDFKKPNLKVLHNYDVTSHDEELTIKEVLVKQLYSPVRWLETVKQLDLENYCFYECGPGKTLTGIVRKTINNSKVVNLSEVLL